MEEIATQIVDAIVIDLTDRRGLKSEWRQIDEDIKTEIQIRWRGIIRRLLAQEVAP